ncbi:MAG: Gfo/Idh/MocA family oxidoreductase [Bauldia sp.]|nr:Gfo/Idh/MocA family oxidoreductase [Bauldia sp.]
MDRSLIRKFGRRLRLGMVGGGLGSIIGDTHILALRADGFCDLVSGALSSRPDVARASAETELIAPDRSYADWQEMVERESAREDDRIDAVVIATPPQLHFPVARAFLERGIDVICEKPMTKDLAEAEELVSLVRKHDRLFCLTHCYVGYPMVRQARAMIEAGAIGAVRMIDITFAPGDRGTSLEPEDPGQRHWRFKASSMGKASILGEVNSHAYHMACYLTGLQADTVSAQLSTFAERREVYDNVYATLRFPDGVMGRLWSSYVAAGNDQGFSFIIIGETGQLRWNQEDPEYLWLKPMADAAVTYARGYDDLDERAKSNVRYRPGFPEGYGLAFANLYVDFAKAVMSRKLGLPYAHFLADVPTVEDGARGMKFMAAAARSHDEGGGWIPCRLDG